MGERGRVGSVKMTCVWLYSRASAVNLPTTRLRVLIPITSVSYRSGCSLAIQVWPALSFTTIVNRSPFLRLSRLPSVLYTPNQILIHVVARSYHTC